MKRVVQSASARDDARTTVEFYKREAGHDMASRLVDALRECFGQISQWPAIGSSQWGQVVGIADLRSVAVTGFPYVVFYVERDDCVQVWRILHQRRDLEPLLLAYEG